MAKRERSLADERAFLKTARSRFECAISAESKNRVAALEDLKFLAGDQWPEDIRAARAGANGQPGRPCLTINKMPTFLHQVTNDQRQNRPAISVSPVGDKADKRTADIMRALIRWIERHSSADDAFDTAFSLNAAIGWGYWRLLTEHDEPGSFDQTICVGRIRNPFTVYRDPDRKRVDGSDSMWDFITEKIPREEYENRWPDKDKLAWDAAGIGEDMKEWCDEKSVRIAEYFVVEVEMKRLVALQSGHVGFYDDLDETIKEQIKADPEVGEGHLIVKERESECRQVRWYKITGKQILEEEDWAGKWIPIVEEVGDEIDIEGRVIKAGVIRYGKDPQRQKNYWASALTERVALDVKAPYIMEEGQLEGHEKEWQNANTTATTVLTYKGTNVGNRPAPPPMRQPWGGPPSGVMAAEQQAEQDMMGTMGIRFDATKSERVQDESGIALQQLRSNQTLGAYHYIDNHAKALKFTGDMMLDLIPRIFDTKRIISILQEDGTTEMVQVDPQQAEAFTEIKHGEKGKEKTIKSFNPNVGKYEVAITIGPNYETKRQEASGSMLEFMKALQPQQASAISDLIAKNQDWTESEVVAKRLAMLLPPGMLQQDMKDMSPQVQALVGSLQQQLQQLQQEKQQMMSALTEKNTQHTLEKEKIDRDFEAKMTKIAADMETKMLSLTAERDGLVIERMDNQFKMIFDAVQALEMRNQQPQQQSAQGSGAANA